MSPIAVHLERVREQISQAAARAGRSPSDVQLVAVSKMHPAEAVREAVEAGQLLFGESRVQEAKAKIPLLPSRLHWHFIGHLQSNKIRQALPLFELFHGIDSLDLARGMDRVAAELGLYPQVLLEVNIAGEGTKFGFRPDRLVAEMEELLALPRLQLLGLMTMPPPAPRAEDSRPSFADARKLRDSIEQQFRLKLPQISMGMTGDFEVAVEEGATLVRVGTAIFGPRLQPRPEPRP